MDGNRVVNRVGVAVCVECIKALDCVGMEIYMVRIVIMDHSKIAVRITVVEYIKAVDRLRVVDSTRDVGFIKSFRVYQSCE